MGLLFDTFTLDLGALTAVLITVIYVYFKYSYTYWKKRNVPYIEPTFPIGNFFDNILMKKQIGQVFKDIYDKLDGAKYGGTYLFATPGFIFRDPDIIKSVLVKDFPSFHDRGFYMDEDNEPLTGHLFLLPGTKWRNLRAKLTPTFTSGKMKMMFQTLVDCGIELGKCLQERAKNGEVVEIKDFLGRYSTDIISSCAFGIQCNCLKNPDAEFRQWGRKIFEPSVKASINTLISAMTPGLNQVLKLRTFDEKVSNYFMEMVKETVGYREKNDVKRNDFMNLLIQIKNKGKVDGDQEEVQQSGQDNLDKPPAELGLSMESLAAQAFVFFAAGFETSSTTMAYCLYELSLNPDVQDRVREDIDNVLAKHGGNITYESIQQMEYLDKVVAETLRKYPPLPILNRECTREYRVPGTDLVLNKGMLTVIPVLGLHYDPKYYPNPDKFDPERFSEEEKAKRHHYVYLPFGEGPRICIGLRFGLMQTKVGLVSLLSKYQFSISEKTPVPLVIDKKSFIYIPVGGMWLRIQNRQK